MKFERRHIFYLALSWAVLLLTLFFLAVFNQWFGPPSGVGADFCEASRPGYIRQPANTWSNLGFVFFGLLMAWQLSHAKFDAYHNRFTRSPFTGLFFSCLVIALGPGSMAMHATETSLGGDLDMLSMYLVVSFAASYAMQRYFDWSNIVFTVSFITIVLLCEWAGTYYEPVPVVDYAGNAAFGFFVCVTIVFEMLNAYHRKRKLSKLWGYGSLATLILAFIIWNMWKDGSPLCNPGSLIQGHAMWHLLDSFAAYCLFRFYVSEQGEN
ncbi:MAG: ceramidase [Chitinophagales bacterium]|nr:ceramidase [Chitinophagales bacterium]MDW8419287.1 ceramidase domain-containing protein [Chitinophagales bacterium]